MKRCFFLAVLLCGMSLSPQLYAQEQLQLRSPLLFVTAVPTTFQNSSGITNLTGRVSYLSAFGSHLAGAENAPRGGDLWIRYPDGSMRNLTKEAGYGNEGFQGKNAIAVREPSVHWDGKKAIFSMVIGAPESATDATQFNWQLYEVCGLGKNEKVVITKVPNQPENYNNISPIYGTDDKIIFVSDKPHENTPWLYPRLDEANADPVNTGLWSLNPETGSIVHLDNAPSGVFTPSIDSYGRLTFTRWDHLQQDPASLSNPSLPFGTTLSPFNYANENNVSAEEATPMLKRADYYPEAAPTTTTKGHSFGFFAPWAINEDGSDAMTINHTGRHDYFSAFPGSNTGVDFKAENNFNRANKNPVTVFFNLKENTCRRGQYIGVDVANNPTAAIINPTIIQSYYPSKDGSPQTGSLVFKAGRIFTVELSPTMDPNETTVNIVANTGVARNPVMTTDNKLITSVVGSEQEGKQSATSIILHSPVTMRLSSVTTFGLPSPQITPGFTKDISLYINGRVFYYQDTLWEIDPVEVVVRKRPQQRHATVASVEQQVFNEENVQTDVFERYLQQHNQALLVIRDVTQRDRADAQQATFLRVYGTNKLSTDKNGAQFTVEHLQFFEGQNLRGYSSGEKANKTILAGRRIIPVPASSVKAQASPDVPAGCTKIAADGSAAALVPAGKPVTWQLRSHEGDGIVRERYWLTFKSGEIRTCTSCHGGNPEATNPTTPVPQNKPEALRTLLRSWKENNIPARVQLEQPFNGSAVTGQQPTLTWKTSNNATRYVLSLAKVENGARTTLFTKELSAELHSYTPDTQELGSEEGNYVWSVQAFGEWGNSLASEEWAFSTLRSATTAIGDEENSALLSLSPSPANRETMLRFTASTPSPCSISLIDTYGREVITRDIGTISGTISIPLAVDNLASGSYSLLLRMDRNILQKRLIVMH